MLVKTGNTDKEGILIYRNVLNGKDCILNTVSGVTNKTKHNIPSYAFSIMGIR